MDRGRGSTIRSHGHGAAGGDDRIHPGHLRQGRIRGTHLHRRGPAHPADPPSDPAAQPQEASCRHDVLHRSVRPSGFNELRRHQDAGSCCLGPPRPTAAPGRASGECCHHRRTPCALPAISGFQRPTAVVRRRIRPVHSTLTAVDRHHADGPVTSTRRCRIPTASAASPRCRVRSVRVASTAATAARVRILTTPATPTSVSAGRRDPTVTSAATTAATDRGRVIARRRGTTCGTSTTSPRCRGDAGCIATTSSAVAGCTGPVGPISPTTAAAATSPTHPAGSTGPSRRGVVPATVTGQGGLARRPVRRSRHRSVLGRHPVDRSRGPTPSLTRRPRDRR